MTETRPNTPFEAANRVLSHAQQELSDYIGNLPPRKIDQSGNDWIRYRALTIDSNGEDSVATLLPRNISCNSRLLTLTINQLSKCGIRSKDDLLSANLDRLENENPRERGTIILGKKTKEFATLMQNVVIAEKYTEWNSWNK